MPLAPPEWMLRLFGRALYRAFVGRVINGLPAEFALTSWYRTPAGNAAVRGHADSQHLLGLAADFVVRDPQLTVTALTGQGLTALNEGDHVHVQAFPAGVVAPVLRLLRL